MFASGPFEYSAPVSGEILIWAGIVPVLTDDSVLSGYQTTVRCASGQNPKNARSSLADRCGVPAQVTRPLGNEGHRLGPLWAIVENISLPTTAVLFRFIREVRSRTDRAIHGYQGTVTLVILPAFRTCRILASPTTEPGRRGWKRRLGSPISAPHFFACNLTHPDYSPTIPRFSPCIE